MVKLDMACIVITWENNMPPVCKSLKALTIEELNPSAERSKHAELMSP
jgi:hypothetical protein